MALVGYSDSEDSDTGDVVQLRRTTIRSNARCAGTSNSNKHFQKVDDPSKPHRILVSLPDVSVKVGSTAPAGKEVAADMPPAKRARTAGAFSGFNSILPAPKNIGISVTGNIDVANTSGLGRSRGIGLGKAAMHQRMKTRRIAWEQKTQTLHRCRW